MATGGVNLSGEFFELLKAIGESKSKQEEDRIMLKEMQVLKTKLENSPTQLNSKKKNKEFLVRLLYLEMLGHDGSFGYMKAVECAAAANVAHKRTGYLLCACCLPPDHEFRFMLVNQMQRDISSSSVLEVCGGLLAATRLVTADMVPALTTPVQNVLGHEHATVRKKAIVCWHRLFQLNMDAIGEESMMEQVRKLLCDKDPAVMGACLPVIYQLCLDLGSADAGGSLGIQAWKDLVPSLVSILKQIGERRLPSEYDYHRTPAPWMQLMLLRILGVLGKGDPTASAGMYEILGSTLQAADTGINAGYAIVYECVKTIVSIYPHASLLDTAAQAIARFMDAPSHNLKYLGVTGLAWIVEQSPAYAAPHQLAVMDCLEDPDETLQRKTLELLYRMTNPVNVEFIVEKLVEFMQRTPDLALRKQLALRVSDVSERYAPNQVWYIKTATQLLTVAGDLVDSSVASTVMNLLAEGTGESEEQDMLLRQTAVELYVDLLLDESTMKGEQPALLLETMAWCLGEYGYLSAVVSLDTLLAHLSAWPTPQPSTQRSVLGALAKLVAQAGHVPTAVTALVEVTTKAADAELQQRGLEFQQLLTQMPHVLPEVFPVDASAEDVVIDLSCLNGIVQEALNNGARPYDASLYDADDDDDDIDGSLYGSAQNGGFKMTPYEKPNTAVPPPLSAPRVLSRPGVPLPPGAAEPSTLTTNPSASNAAGAGSGASSTELRLNTRNVANVWGKGGLTSGGSGAPAAPPASSQWGTSSQPPQAVASAPPPAPSTQWGAPVAAPPTSSSSWGAPAAPPAPPVKTEAQLERERQAAALFGGITTSTTTTPVPTPPPSGPAPAMPGATAASSAPPATAPAPPPVPAPAAPAVDLLDLGGWDDSPADPVPAAAPGVDAFAPSANAHVVVETVSDDDDVLAAPSPAAAPAPLDVDPFASAGLLDDSDQPLPALAQAPTPTFSYQGSNLTPWTISTPDFGQQWTALTASQTAPPPTVTLANNCASLTDATSRLTKAGVHVVQIIGTEAISAGQWNGLPVLLHAAAVGGKVNVTIQCTNSGVATALAVYLPNAA